MQDMRQGREYEEIDLLDYLTIIVKRKSLIIRAMIAVFCISSAISFLLPKYYSSTARILPPQQDQGLMGLMMGSMGNGMASLAGDFLGKGSPTDLYMGILSTATISDAIIDRFKLMDVYEEKYRIDAYKALDKKVDFSAGKKDGIISITVEDKDPKRAADLANAYVEELGKLTAHLSMTDAGQNKSFLNERLAKAKVDLAKAEDEIKIFQSRNKALDVTEQAKGAIKGVADLEGQLAAEEVKLAGAKRVFTDDSQEVKNQKAVVANIKGQIAKFEGMRSGAAVLGVGSVPELGQQYLRLMREFKTQEALVEVLTKQYELAKLSEAKEISSIWVLQNARVPDKKSKPRRVLIILASTFTAGFLAILCIFINEYWQNLPVEEKERWLQFKEHFRNGNRLP
jgi:uncharacterized protein involved in exopolysaccharide biosynthesis